MTACTPGRVEDGNARVCGGVGNLALCQLCPASPTYWRRTAPTPGPDPYTATGSRAPLVPAPSPYQGLIDGRDPKARWSLGVPSRCIICMKPAILRSPKGVPCHKICAEQWTRDHPRRMTPAA